MVLMILRPGCAAGLFFAGWLRGLCLRDRDVWSGFRGFARTRQRDVVPLIPVCESVRMLGKVSVDDVRYYFAWKG